MGDKLKEAKEYFDKAKPRSKGSAGRESAEQSRKKAVNTIAKRREKVAEIDRAYQENPGFLFKNREERDRIGKLQPGPKDYPEFTYDSRSKGMIVPAGFSALRDTDGGYFRGRTLTRLKGGTTMDVFYPGLMLRSESKKK